MNTEPHRPEILVLGGINMGLITRSCRLPKPGETLRGEVFYSSSGGKGATQAVAAARLGARVKMVGRVGEDLFGPALLSALDREGIDVSDIAVDEEHASGVGVIILDAQGQNHVLATYGANLQCGDKELEAVEQHLERAQILVLQMEIPFELSMRAAQRAKARGVRVLLDPAPAREIPAAAHRYFDIIAPNQTEAELLTGIAVIDLSSAQRAAGVLRGRGVGTAIIKLGELGVYFESARGQGFVPPFPVEVVDTTSAGDAFHGALAVGLAEGKQLEEAIRFAAAAGALAVTQPGVQDAMPWRDQVDVLLGGKMG
jgi:ribokinase